MIPQHCIDNFKDRYNVYPFIIELDILDGTTIVKLLKKSLDKWSYGKSMENKIVDVERLVEYDPAGIFMYYKTEDNLDFKLFIMYTSDRKSVVDFTVHNILKTIKK